MPCVIQTFVCFCRPLHPSILWAQRSDTVLLTVSLNDIRDETFSLEENGFEFSGVGGAEGRMYEARIEFYKDILPQVTNVTQCNGICWPFLSNQSFIGKLPAVEWV